MTQTFGQLPRRNPPQSQARPAASGSLIVVVLLFGFTLIARVWIVAFWIFGDEIGRAFTSWIIPAIGLLVVPWTTLLYAWMWTIGSDAVHGWEWLPVAVGFLIDMSFLAALRRLFN